MFERWSFSVMCRCLFHSKLNHTFDNFCGFESPSRSHQFPGKRTEKKRDINLFRWLSSITMYVSADNFFYGLIYMKQWFNTVVNTKIRAKINNTARDTDTGGPRRDSVVDKPTHRHNVFNENATRIPLKIHKHTGAGGQCISRNSKSVYKKWYGRHEGDIKWKLLRLWRWNRCVAAAAAAAVTALL